MHAAHRDTFDDRLRSLFEGPRSRPAAHRHGVPEWDATGTSATTSPNRPPRSARRCRAHHVTHATNYLVVNAWPGRVWGVCLGQTTADAGRLLSETNDFPDSTPRTGEEGDLRPLDHLVVMNPRDADKVQASRELLERAREKYGELLGPRERWTNVPGLGLPARPVTGPCRICRETRKLTFEHIPPRASGNQHTTRSIDIIAALNREDRTSFPSSGWTQQQRGAGAYTLCSSCNSRSGRFATEYARWVGALGEITHEASEAAGEADVPVGVHVELEPVYPGRIIRQVAAMILAVSGGPWMAERHPSLKTLALDDVAVELPGDHHFYVTLASGNPRLVPPMVKVDLEDGTLALHTEVAFPPFAWLFVAGPAPAGLNAVCVTEWSQITPDEVARFEADLPLAIIRGPLPSDYASPTSSDSG